MLLVTPTKSKSPGLSSKFKLTTSQIQKDIDHDDEELLAGGDVIEPSIK